MMDYYFRTQTTMKLYNRDKWWIDEDCVKDKDIEAENLKEALVKYAEEVDREDYISISKNALKNKSPMYIDDKEGKPKQIGYVLTGKTDFQDDNYKWSEHYIDLWVEITGEYDIDFPDDEL